MTRNALLLVLALVVVMVVSNVVYAVKTDALKATGDSLRLRVAATNVRLDAFADDSAGFAAERTRFDSLTSLLRADLGAARRNRQVVIVSRDSARATVELDTLTPQLQELIVLEREAAVSFQQERDLERELRISTEAQLARARDRMSAAESLIWTLAAERDSAMALVARHEARLSFNLWRFLGNEIPQLMACAGAGAVVAELYDGKVLIGAGIGLAACLVKSAVFK